MKKKIILIIILSFLFLEPGFVLGQVGKCGGVSSCVYKILGITTKTYCSVPCGLTQVPAPECSGCPGSPCNCKCVADPKCSIISIPPTTARKLEINYPTFGGLGPGKGIESYVAYFYHFAIIISGIIALVAMIYGGIEWLISPVSPAKVADARKRIFGGFLGLIILLSSYLILSIINPNLTFITLTKKEPKPLITPQTISGVWFCNEDISKPKTQTEVDNIFVKKCLQVSTGPIPQEYQGQNLKKIHIFRPAGYPYNYLIFYDDKPKGQWANRCGVVASKNGELSQFGLLPKEAKYVDVGTFSNLFPAGAEIKFCEQVQCKERGKEWTYSPAEKGKIITWPSLKITPVRSATTMGGEFLAILFNKNDFKGECYQVRGTEWNLGANFKAGVDPVSGSPYATINSMILIPQK